MAKGAAPKAKAASGGKATSRQAAGSASAAAGKGDAAGVAGSSAASSLVAQAEALTKSGARRRLGRRDSDEQAFYLNNKCKACILVYQVCIDNCSCFSDLRFL